VNLDPRHIGHRGIALGPLLLLSEGATALDILSFYPTA
jgi:hypothetical protein